MRPLALSLAAAVLVLGIAPSAWAKGWYVAPFAMTGFTNHTHEDRSPTSALPISGSSDSMLSGGGGLWTGYDFGAWSLELGGSYRARYDANFRFTDITTNPAHFGAKANVETADLMLSALYDIPVTGTIQPYIGGGIGLAHHQLETDLLTGSGITQAASSSATDIAWQAQAGVKYPLGASTFLRLEYRYTDQGTIETSPLPTGTNDRLSADLLSHDIRVGMAWSF